MARGAIKLWNIMKTHSEETCLGKEEQAFVVEISSSGRKLAAQGLSTSWVQKKSHIICMPLEYMVLFKSAEETEMNWLEM